MKLKQRREAVETGAVGSLLGESLEVLCVSARHGQRSSAADSRHSRWALLATGRCCFCFYGPPVPSLSLRRSIRYTSTLQSRPASLPPSLACAAPLPNILAIAAPLSSCCLISFLVVKAISPAFSRPVRQPKLLRHASHGTTPPTSRRRCFLPPFQSYVPLTLTAQRLVP